MKKLVECIPNISEGRNKKTIDTIVGSITDVDVLSVESGYDTNRTVITMAGEPEAIFNAAYSCIETSHKLIDMRNHTGIHIRHGCVDVCPFVPLSGTTMTDCIDIARNLGKKVSEQLGIPVYLYGNAAFNNKRSDLSLLRKGGYENIEKKITIYPPDYGPATVNNTVKKSGIINIGARNFLIAFNINLNTNNIKAVKEIASCIRESGNGKKRGKLEAVKGLGWYIDEYKMAQLSYNLLDYNRTPLHILYETSVEETEKRGIKIHSSELIGLIPKQAILDAGNYYSGKSGLGNLNEKEKIHLAVRSLKLDKFQFFDINKKILEFNLNGKIKI